MDDMVRIYYLYITQVALILSQMPTMWTRRWAVRPINADWNSGGYFNKTFGKIKDMDDEQFFIHTRMNKKLFNMLLNLLGTSLSRPRQRITKEERLSMTLLYLAHAGSMQSIAWSYKIGKSTVRKTILETCEALWKILSVIYPAPPTESQYRDIEAEFNSMWNMPKCVGAVDGKHIAIKCPKNSGSAWFNYKKYFSTVLMGACDARYTFISVSIGSYGSESDAGVFKLSDFGKALLEEKLPLPPNKPLPGSEDNTAFPHYFVGDAAFPLSKNLMKPIAPPRSREPLDLASKVFNYRLSRARRTIENAFGILAARWRILNTTLEFMPENCEKIVLACVALHNFIMLNDQERLYCPDNYVERDTADNEQVLGEWRRDDDGNGGLRDVTSHARRSSARALQLREKLRSYFSEEGAIPFQPQE